MPVADCHIFALAYTYSVPPYYPLGLFERSQNPAERSAEAHIDTADSQLPFGDVRRKEPSTPLDRISRPWNLTIEMGRSNQVQVRSALQVRNSIRRRRSRDPRHLTPVPPLQVAFPLSSNHFAKQARKHAHAHTRPHFIDSSIGPITNVPGVGPGKQASEQRSDPSKLGDVGEGGVRIMVNRPPTASLQPYH